MALMWTNVIFESNSDLYKIKWEVLAFRAGWVLTVQLPLLYATALKVNPITILTGISYERINWLHRWIARFMVITLFLHAFFFLYEWGLTNSIMSQFRVLPMALWGLSAWGTMILMVLGGWRYIRSRFYEAWIISHILSAYVALALTYTHTRCTTYFVFISLALLLFDATGRTILWLRNNVCYPIASGSESKLGHIAHLQALDEEYVKVELRNTSLRWKPGQHIMLQAPQVSFSQSHPFTISSLCDGQRKAVLVIKKHAGFTHRLGARVSKNATRPLQVYVSGPFGNAPSLATEDTVVFISTGNRASYTYALLLDLLSSSKITQTIHFHHIVRNRRILSFFQDQIDDSARAATQVGVQLLFNFHITSAVHHHAEESDADTSLTLFDIGEGSSTGSSRAQSIELAKFRPSGSSLMLSQAEKEPPDIGDQYQTQEPFHHGTEEEAATLLGVEKAHALDEEGRISNGPEFVKYKYCDGRQSADVMLRPAVVDAVGDVAVVGAVPSQLAAEMSQVVSRMSKELGLASGKSSVRSLRLWLESYG
ncbi:hypothetical protein LTR84_006595 [Exophiala bonariae]|uniref:ferric-chelate reductase (NADPH) n=1 Tax=Exophiala bonariae TaxID=1690606 RepID=A0AAV9N3M2_9EURO|nr:hypothetical protein LTR84_006595 [Exophiala bonariae]